MKTAWLPMQKSAAKTAWLPMQKSAAKTASLPIKKSAPKTASLQIQKSAAKTASLPIKKSAAKTASLSMQKSTAKTESTILYIYIYIYIYFFWMFTSIIWCWVSLGSYGWLLAMTLNPLVGVVVAICRICAPCSCKWVCYCWRFAAWCWDLLDSVPMRIDYYCLGSGLVAGVVWLDC